MNHLYLLHKQNMTVLTQEHSFLSSTTINLFNILASTEEVE